jgi:predicted transcriptional regulator
MIDKELDGAAAADARSGGNGAGNRDGGATGQRGYKEIMFDIALSISRGRALKAHLMSDCRVSYQRINFYLSAMASAGLIVKGLQARGQPQGGRVQYMLTSKGARWVEAQLLADRILEEEEGEQGRQGGK